MFGLKEQTFATHDRGSQAIEETRFFGTPGLLHFHSSLDGFGDSSFTFMCDILTRCGCVLPRWDLHNMVRITRQTADQR